MNVDVAPKPLDILLVEDNPGDMRLTVEALREGKVLCKLHWVEDGVEALDFLYRRGKHIDAARPDLILLDLNLPRMDGREVLQHIKTDAQLRRIPVVILTSSREDRDLTAAYDLGVNSYIEKPVSFSKFMEVAEQIELYWCVLNERPGRA